MKIKNTLISNEKSILIWSFKKAKYITNSNKKNIEASAKDTSATKGKHKDDIKRIKYI